MKDTHLFVVLLNILKLVLVNFSMVYAEAASPRDGACVKQGSETLAVAGRSGKAASEATQVLKLVL